MRRRGITNIALEAVIGLVLVGITFAVSFFVYNSFIDSMTSSQVTAGFMNFVKPIEKVCQGGTAGDAVQTGVTLPYDTAYTYGIFQTKLNPSVGYEPNMPLEMRKCEDSYCLCLFRLQKPARGYDSWHLSADSAFFGLLDFFAPGYTSAQDDAYQGDPAPLWHYNSPGVRIFPTMLKRSFEMLLIRLGAYLIFHVIFIKWLLPHLTCSSICTAATAGAGASACWLGCNALTYGIAYAMRDAAVAFLTNLIEESTEPFMFVNYPMAFMSVSDSDYLQWTDSDGKDDADMYLEAEARYVDITEQVSVPGLNYVKSHNTADATPDFTPAMAAADLTGSDWVAIGEMTGQAALKGFVEGVFKGVGATGGSSGFWGKLMNSRTFQSVSRLLVTKARIEIQEAAAYAALDFDFPATFKPKAYVRPLLSIRQQMSLTQFASVILPLDWSSWSNFWQSFGDLFILGTPRPPPYDYYWDPRVETFSGFDIINCVKISELGPKCDGSTKVLMDYDHDAFMAFRLTDPINYPYKAVFCGYDGEKDEFDINLVTMCVDGVKAQVLSVPTIAESEVLTDIIEAVIDLIGGLVNWLLGDVLLAGAHTMQGMFMECVQPQIVMDYKSEYFQYWVAHYDPLDAVGSSGGIQSITARLTMTDEELACKTAELNRWKSCGCNYVTYLTSITPVSAAYTGISCATALSPVTASLADYYANSFASDKNAVCAWDGISGDCSSVPLPNPSNLTCYDIFYPRYLKCNPGVHLEFGGVLQ